MFYLDALEDPTSDDCSNADLEEIRINTRKACRFRARCSQKLPRGRSTPHLLLVATVTPKPTTLCGLVLFSRTPRRGFQPRALCLLVWCWVAPDRSDVREFLGVLRLLPLRSSQLVSPRLTVNQMASVAFVVFVWANSGNERLDICCIFLICVSTSDLLIATPHHRRNRYSFPLLRLALRQQVQRWPRARRSQVLERL
ncbi:hypothetical protein BDZ97DRAFT_1836619 [Flammula alnicola]|nr:hypothetical protein BDZ97DRAFT_1836619 [Flammula alnicola]